MHLTLCSTLVWCVSRTGRVNNKCHYAHVIACRMVLDSSFATYTCLVAQLSSASFQEFRACDLDFTYGFAGSFEARKATVVMKPAENVRHVSNRCEAQSHALPL